MKVLFIISSLTSTGGAERVLVTMANYWVEKGWDIEIATFDNGKTSPAYDLSSKVNHNPLNIAHESPNKIIGLIKNLTRIKRLNKDVKISNPDIIISFSPETNITTLFSTFYNNVPVIVSERNYPGFYPIDPIRARLRRWLYPRASKVVCQTQLMLDYYMPLIQDNGVVIPNPVLKSNYSLNSPEVALPEGKLLFAMGSMSKVKINQKGFDLLIPAFAKLANKYKDWNLVILGDGPERTTLQSWINELSLNKRVYLPGNVKNVYSVLSKGDLFVLSSRYEGFPNALCEAMACGLPVVSFNCPTGPGDIIRDGLDGLLVPPENIANLEEKLNIFMADKSKREGMGNKAKEIVDRFSLSKIMGMWENILKSTLGEKY